MKTKAGIVQKLLEEKKIDAEEAVILLMGEEKTIQFIPYPHSPIPFFPQNPIYPAYPSWPYSPVVCSAVTNNADDRIFWATVN